MVWSWLWLDSELEPNEVSGVITVCNSTLYVHAQRTVCNLQLSKSTSSLVSCLVSCMLLCVFTFHLLLFVMKLLFVAH